MEIYEAELDQLLRSQHRDPLLRHLTSVVVESALGHAGPPGACPAIDIGCGLGRTSLALAEAGFSVLGLDPSSRAVELAGRAASRQAGLQGRLAFMVADATEAPPEPWRAAFDLAVCSEVIEHVEAPERVLAFAWEVLRPGGLLILTTPHDPEQWTVMDDYAAHISRFTEAQMRDLLARFELQELATEGFPFQRSVMQGYDRMLARSEGEHRYDAFGDSLAYRLYAGLMPLLLRLDHQLRDLRRGTTWIALARKPLSAGEA